MLSLLATHQASKEEISKEVLELQVGRMDKMQTGSGLPWHPLSEDQHGEKVG